MSDKILFVGEDESFISGLQKNLQMSGVESTLLLGGRALADFLETGPSADSFQCVVSELYMRNGGGEAVLFLVRNSVLGALPVILTVSTVDQATVKKLLETGVDGILCKPFSEDALHTEIKLAKERREATALRKSLSKSG